MKTWFESSQQSHVRGLGMLNSLYEYDDVMESICSVLDLGSGVYKSKIETRYPLLLWLDKSLQWYGVQ